MKAGTVMDRLTELAIRIQSLAQAGLAYGKDPFDLERYRELRRISTELLSAASGAPADTIEPWFCNETGYQTPKLDTRAAVLREGKILLVHEKNGTWALPGGWCDVDRSVASNTVKEVREETGLDVTPVRLVAVQDWRRHNRCNLPFGVIKTFMLCEERGGTFRENIETTEARYFAADELPENLAPEKSTREQIRLCFDAAAAPAWQTVFD